VDTCVDNLINSNVLNVGGIRSNNVHHEPLQVLSDSPDLTLTELRLFSTMGTEQLDRRTFYKAGARDGGSKSAERTQTMAKTRNVLPVYCITPAYFTFHPVAPSTLPSSTDTSTA
jgi:hypothetical protein